jgi:cell wall-associated NlpC family hydrolase
MKYLIIFFIVQNLFSFDLKEGDIVFQETNSEQSRAIKLATKSKYTHVGIVLSYNSKLMILEAIGPVKITEVDSFLKRSLNNHYKIKRLKNAEQILTNQKLELLKAEGSKYLGKPYDIYFGWGNDRIYCSELVWKLYKTVLGIEIGKLSKLKDFDLSHWKVKYLMFKRYGFSIPYEETVIPPSSLYDSELLYAVE